MQAFNQFFAGNDGDALDITNISTLSYPEDWLTEALTGGQKSDAGVAVNGYTALTWCPLWQGVNIIAGDLGQVPFWLMKDEFSEQRNHPVWELLTQRPNELQSTPVFFETIWQWLIVWGNAVCYIPRIGSRVTDMIPLRPDCVWTELRNFDIGQRLLYHYWSPTASKEFIFLPDEVLHVQGLTSDGIWGYPLWQVGKNTIGGGLSVEKHGNKSFANAARPSGVLKFPGKLPPDARANLRREWESLHSGADNSGRVAILVDGAEFQAMAQTHVEAQWAESKTLSAIEAACLLNLPAYKLNVQESMGTKSNLEEQNETYKQMTLTRHANKFCREAERKLLPGAQWKSGQFRIVPKWDFYFEADIDTKSLIADRNIKNTIWNPNEGRRYLGYAPREGGDEYGNPATSSSGLQPEDGKQMPDNGRPPGATTQNAHRELLLDRMSHLLEREGHNLTRAATNAKNFLVWLDDFYSGPQSTFVVLAESITGPSVRASLAVGLDARGTAAAVATYAKTRHAQIIEACSTVTKEQLPAIIERLNGTNTPLIAQGLLATALGETNGT